MTTPDTTTGRRYPILERMLDDCITLAGNPLKTGYKRGSVKNISKVYERCFPREETFDITLLIDRHVYVNTHLENTYSPKRHYWLAQALRLLLRNQRPTSEYLYPSPE